MRSAFASLLVLSLLSAAPTVRAQDDGGEKPEKKDEQPPEKKPDANQRRNRFQAFRYPIERLKEQLKLSDEQYKKVEEFADELGARFRKDVQEQGDNFDLSKMREMMPRYMHDMQEKVRSILTDDQKPKYEEMVKEEEKRMKEGPRDARFGRDPEQIKKRLMEQAEKELALSANEKQAVLPLIQKVLDARAEARTNYDKRKEEFTDFSKKATGQDEAGKAAIQKRLEEFRKAREVDLDKIKDAEAALRDVLTIENEAKLVALGILD
jgi:hypothetical protein